MTNQVSTKSSKTRIQADRQNSNFPNYHISVLLNEVMEGLNIKAGGRYIDATLGGGGHTEKILERGGKVLGIDRDKEAMDYVSGKLAKWMENGNLRLENANFDQLKEIAEKNDWRNAQGILFDLGVSSHQIDTAFRGFSFQSEGPLDMRMDMTLSVTAADLVNALSEKELKDLFFRFGGEKKSGLIARAIVETRKKRKIKTTRELAEAIERVIKNNDRLHPATKVFMALRIVVNDELNSLEKALPQAVELLVKGGRLVVISFHEGEDRIVKNFFRRNELLKMINKKPIMVERIEIISNPRARSAKLRVAEKI